MHASGQSVRTQGNPAQADDRQSPPSPPPPSTSPSCSSASPASGSPSEDSSIEVTDLVQRINSRALSVRDVPIEQRRLCVAYLTEQGFANHEIVQVLGICERTIRSDRQALRGDQALAPDRKLGDQLLGEYQSLTHACIRRLIRLGTDSNNPPYARLWAEDSISRIYQRFIDTARKLGYLEDGRARLDPDQIPLDPQFIEQQHARLQLLGTGDADDEERERRSTAETG